MDFRVLGSVGIVDRDQPLPVGGSKPRRLLGVLLANRNAVVSTDQLVDVLWSEPPETAAATLQSYVSRLRKFVDLGEGQTSLRNRAPGYVLEIPEDLVDAGRFERHLEAGRELVAHDPARAITALDAGLGEWRGAAFAEFADAEWVQPEAIRLEELRLVATETRIEAELRVGNHQRVVGQLDALLLDHPLRERFADQLMLALYRSGRQAEALRVAHDFRSRLRDDFGLEASPDLRDLEAAILEEREELAWVPPRDPRGQTRSIRDLRRAIPTESTSLIGREGDLDRAAALLESARLLTLFGSGGVGKTRVAYRLATTLGPRFRDGVRLVELAAVRDERAVIAAVSGALDIQQRPNRSLTDSIVELLAAQEMLLVLDNCEHVLETTSEIAALILRWCSDVKVLATSREPLGIAAEVVCAVGPLAVPDSRDTPIDALENVAAVRLFVDRARAARSDVEFDDVSGAAIAEICIRLDGVPLAIELAAARMRSMSPEQLVERLPERFRMLEAADRTADPRHRTLLDLVQWSYDLLTPQEQRLFERVSVFAGSFDLDRAEHVCGGDDLEVLDVPRLLAALVDKSMVVTERTGPRTRYVQLETLRTFGRDQLRARPEAGSIRAAHARAHIELAELAAIGLTGPDEGAWAAELDDAFDDMREAHAIALANGDLDGALRLVVALREYALRRIRYELLAWAEVTVGVERAPEHALYPVALGLVAYGCFVRGELGAAIEVGERAVAAAERSGHLTYGLAERAIANALFYQDRETEAIGWTDRMIAAVGSLGDPSLVAHAHYMRAAAETSVGNSAGGAALAERAAAAATRSGNPTAHAQAAYALGLSFEKTDPARALRLLDRSVQHAESVENRWIRAFALTESLWIRAQHGHAAEALGRYPDVIDTWFRGGDWANQRLTLRHVFAIFEVMGHDEVAATLYGALDAAAVMRALPLGPGNADDFQQAMERLRQRLGTGELEDAAARGRSMRDEEVVRFVLAAISAANVES